MTFEDQHVASDVVVVWRIVDVVIAEVWDIKSHPLSRPPDKVPSTDTNSP